MKSSNKKWKIIKEDYVDELKSVLAENEYKILLRYTFYLNKLVSNTYLLNLKPLEGLKSEK